MTSALPCVEEAAKTRCLAGAVMILLALSLGRDTDAAGDRETGEEEAGTLRLTELGLRAPLRRDTLNDGVMGGWSRGGFLTNNGTLVFYGSTYTNGGGFSSIRTREQTLGLSKTAGIRLRVKAGAAPPSDGPPRRPGGAAPCPPAGPSSRPGIARIAWSWAAPTSRGPSRP